MTSEGFLSHYLGTAEEQNKYHFNNNETKEGTWKRHTKIEGHTERDNILYVKGIDYNKTGNIWNTYIAD
jgi:hypothetical protein